jgi:periplasmic divalent cation tolerance protein
MAQTGELSNTPDHPAADPTAAAVVYTTFPDAEVARRIAHDVVARGLAACVNLLPGMVAVYRWEGRVEQACEVAAILKTRAALVPDLMAAIRAQHPYDTPALVAWPLTAGAPAYLAWIAASTEGGRLG